MKPSYSWEHFEQLTMDIILFYAIYFSLPASGHNMDDVEMDGNDAIPHI